MEPLEDRLAPAADAVQTVAADVPATFSESQQTLTLSANLSDTTTPSTTVSEGTVTFSVKDSVGKTVGSDVTATVGGGKASANNFTLPANEPAGKYTIDVSYSDGTSSKFSDGGDTPGTLTVSAASTTTAASTATATFSTSAQNVTLTATVTSIAGIVNEGNVAFTLLDSNGKSIGTTTTKAVTNGSASVSYALPAGTSAGSYTIEADYTDSGGNFDASFDNTHTLTLNAANSTSLGLTKVNINPNLVNGTAQVTITAQVSNAGGTVNEGTLSFTVGSVSGQAKVVNGTASVQLTVPLQGVLNGLNVALSYTDNATPANFANSKATLSVSTNVWNSLLPANLTFNSSNTETMQFALANLPLFGASYSSSTGLLSQISVGSIPVPVTYSNLGSAQVATVAGVPWGMIFRDSNGNLQRIADVETAPDGSLVWVFYDTNHHVIGEMPYGG